MTCRISHTGDQHLIPARRREARIIRGSPPPPRAEAITISMQTMPPVSPKRMVLSLLKFSCVAAGGRCFAIESGISTRRSPELPSSNGKLARK